MRAAHRLVLALLLLATAAGRLAAQEGDVPVASTDAAQVAPEAGTMPVGNDIVVRQLPLGQLGTNVWPRAYRLDLTVDPAAPEFAGQVQIDVDLTVATETVYLHGRDLVVSAVRAAYGARLVEGRWEQMDATGVARVAFAEPLPAGRVTLIFDYSARFADGPAGMFHLEVDGEWYSWTQFQSIDARAAFPAFDQPGFKTPFTVTLRTPPGLMAISNAPELGEPVLEQGKAVHRFAPTLPLPTYLVAMMVGPFASLEGQAGPTPQRSWPLPLRIISTAQNRHALSFAFAGTDSILGLLEEYFGEPFPFPKLDQVTSPILPGAMENAGANLYRDDLLVLDDRSPVLQQREFGVVTAHELGHQWFGDLVTPQWWDDIWLNEAFANWMGYRIAEQWRPDLGIRGEALSTGFAAMEADALLAGRPVRQPIELSSNIDSAFDAITYGKGGHVVGMIAAWLGEETFREGVRRHIAAHRFGNATSEDFFAALAHVAGNPALVPALRSFVEQQGVPLIALRRDGDKVHVVQLRYTTAGVAPPDQIWILPLCFRRGSQRHCVLMDQRSQSFTVNGEGTVFPNAGGTGYYRFELDEQHWRDLIVHADALPGEEALALVDSLEASILAGRGTIEEMGRLARKLSRHPDPHAASAPDAALARLVSSGLVDARGRRVFRMLRERIYGPLLKQYGFDPRSGVYEREAPARIQRRAQVVAALLATGRGRDLRKQLKGAALAYMAGDRAALDSAWFAHAFDVYLFDEGRDAVQLLVDKALSSEDPVFRPEALAAAARRGDEKVAAWLMALDDTRLRESERREFLDGLMARKATREFGYRWALEHAGDLLGSGDGQFFAARLPRSLGQFCSVEKAREIARDFSPLLRDTPGALELDRAVERVRNCGLLDEMLGRQINEEFMRLNR